MTAKNKFKFFILSLLLINLILANVTIARADQMATSTYVGSNAESSIRDLLCTPTPSSGTDQNVNSNDLYNCINKIYRVAIVIASVGGMGMIIYAGYLYMMAGGNQEAVGKAKSIINSTIAALVILFIGYLLLKTINPNLVQYQPIQPNSVRPASTTPPSAGGVSTNCNQSFGNSPASGCSGSDCIDVSSYASSHDCSSNGGVCLLSSSAAVKAQALINTFNQSGSGCTLKISAAIEGSSGPSVSSCHKNGTCADFNLIPYNSACAQAFYQAAQSAGVVSLLNEYESACVAQSTTGGNIHVNF